MENDDRNNLTEAKAELSELPITVVETVESATKEKKPEGSVKNKFFLNLYDFVSIIMTAFIIIAVMFTFVFRLVGVIGQSMESTISENDWLITVQKEEYSTGDIVVITQPNYFNEPLIKRVIATGGQTITVDYASSTVYVDGVALDEPYTNEDFLVQQGDDFTSYPYTVPEGELFCMGDNRNHSTDSRSSMVGPIDERYILGKAVVRIIPFGSYNIYDYRNPLFHIYKFG